MQRILLAGLSAALAACAAEHPPIPQAVVVSRPAADAAPTYDQVFLRESYRDARFVIELARLAQKAPGSLPLYDFAAGAIVQHQQLATALRRVAERETVSLPETLRPEQRELLSRLSLMDLADFERTFTPLMVEAHNHEVQTFEQAAISAREPTVRAFAADTLPTLRQGLEAARQLPGQTSERHSAR